MSLRQNTFGRAWFLYQVAVFGSLRSESDYNGVFETAKLVELCLEKVNRL